MTIMTRFMRLCRADIHGVMDQLEDKGLVLKQYLRDMEKELDEKENKLRKMGASLNQAQREYEKHARESARVEQDLTVAIEKDKDDIARVLIRKLKSLTGYMEELARHVDRLQCETARYRNGLNEQRLQYEQLQLRSAEYLRSLELRQWETALSGILPQAMGREPSDEEVEIELLQRKEAVKGGDKT